MQGTSVSVRAIRVADDSRCPVDVTCVWAGDAAVHIDVRIGARPAQAIVLHTSPDRAQTAQVEQVLFRLARLDPAAVSSAPIAQSAYRIEVLVSEARQ